MGVPETLLAECLREERKRLGEREIRLTLDLDSALALAGELHLALCQAGNQGFCADVARCVIEGLIAQLRAGGYEAHAALAGLGSEGRHV